MAHRTRPKSPAKPPGGEAGGTLALSQTLDDLAHSYGAQQLAELLRAYLKKVTAWKPGCDTERTYTYLYKAVVENCDLSDDDEAAHEDKAQKKAEDKVKRLCERNDDCKKLDIIDSSLAKSGCNCIKIPLGKVCIYEVEWTVKYKCSKKAQ